MADEEEAEDEGPIVELGEGESVEGAPLARVASRLYFGIEMSEVERRVGDIEIRTSDGPQELTDILADVDETYFPRRQDFEDAVRRVVGTGPVPTAEE
jgi:hypothetical protein